MTKPAASLVPHCEFCNLKTMRKSLKAGMGQYIDFPIFFNILVMLILILILNSGFPKYRYWSWSWNLQVQNLDFDIDIEKKWNIDIDIDIDIAKKQQNYRKIGKDCPIIIRTLILLSLFPVNFHAFNFEPGKVWGHFWIAHFQGYSKMPSNFL